VSEHEHDEQAAQQAEQDRLDKSAAENEAVRRAEHPEEFAGDTATNADAGDGDTEPAKLEPVAPAGTGADETHEPDPVELEKLSDLERGAAETNLEHAKRVLEDAAGELRRKLFGAPTL
jgi:hypothetical protein